VIDGHIFEASAKLPDLLLTREIVADASEDASDDS
jgi:hypothetical protein